MPFVSGIWLWRFLCFAFTFAVIGSVAQTANPCDDHPCQSSDYQCIPLTAYPNYECICARNCMGPVEVEPSPCRPNPCERDCECHESCKHAGGYFCRSESGFLGKNCSILSAPFNGVYEMTIPLPFTACKTTVEETKEGILFSNQMWFNRRVSNAMFDMPVPAANFQCLYNRVYKLVTSMKPVVSTPVVVTSRTEIFPTVSLCKVADCPAECPEMYRVSGGAFYTVGEMIHVTMSLDAGIGTVGVVDMYLSCSRDPESSGVANIVDGGCVARTGLPSFIRSSFVSDTVCVSFQTPSALGCTEFYIHAELQSCERSNTEICLSSSSDNLRCRSTRRRRSSPQVAVLGPLVILNGSAGQPVVKVNGLDENDWDFATVGKGEHGKEFRSDEVDVTTLVVDVTDDVIDEFERIDAWIIALIVGVSSIVIALFICGLIICIRKLRAN